MRRFYLPPDKTKQSAPLIEGSDAKHISKVLRLKPKERIILFDGTGTEYDAVIDRIGPENVRLSITGSHPCQNESPVEIIVAQAFLKDKKMDELIRRLTELGISRWMPFSARRSVPVPDIKKMGNRITRWNKIATEAVKQCERGKIPEITPVKNLEAVLEAGSGCDAKILFYERDHQVFPPPGSIEAAIKKVLIVLGPEGGFEPKEIKAARSSGFMTAGLGPRVLRAETATVAACALTQYFFGDMKTKIP